MPRTVGVKPTGYVLRITLTGGTVNAPCSVTSTNRNTGEYRRLKVDSDSVAVNMADLSSNGKSNGTFSGFSNGDVIECRVHGTKMGSATHAVDTSTAGGELSITVQDISSSNVPEVNA